MMCGLAFMVLKEREGLQVEDLYTAATSGWSWVCNAVHGGERSARNHRPGEYAQISNSTPHWLHLGICPNRENRRRKKKGKKKRKKEEEKKEERRRETGVHP